MKKILVLLLPAALFFTSCRKDTAMVQPPPAASGEKQLKKAVTTTWSGAVETETYQYDAQGRMLRWTNDKQVYLFDYSVPGKLSVVKKDSTTGELLMTYDCTLNADGNVTKLLSKNPDGSPYTTVNYTYNDAGFVNKQEYQFGSGGSTVTEYTIQDGNVTGYVDRDQSGALKSSATLTYVAGVKNTFNYATSGYFPGPMFGKYCKNLQENLVVKNSSGAIFFESRRTWELDAAGYIKKDHTDYPVSGKWNETVYTFE